MDAVYDQLSGYGPDHDYWVRLVGDVEAGDLCDLGCGTGMLSVLFARGGCRVTGVDPDPGMLAVARARPGHELVTWVDGYAGDVATGSADMLTMTSHVSQVFLTDGAWREVLIEIRRVLRPGGVLTFDMRNPAARGWERWNPAASRREVVTPEGPAAVWHEVEEVRDGLVRFATTLEYATSGEREVDVDTLRFRDEPTLRGSLAEAGFTVTELHGDWDGSPATPSSRELIVTATRIG